MAFQTVNSGDGTVSTTLYSFFNDAAGDTPAATDDGIYQIELDLSTLALGDVFEFYIYEKVSSAGTQRAVWNSVVAGPLTNPHLVSPAMVLLHGWDVRGIKRAGTDRSIAWSLRQVT